MSVNLGRKLGFQAFTKCGFFNQLDLSVKRGSTSILGVDANCRERDADPLTSCFPNFRPFLIYSCQSFVLIFVPRMVKCVHITIATRVSIPKERKLSGTVFWLFSRDDNLFRCAMYLSEWSYMRCTIRGHVFLSFAVEHVFADVGDRARCLWGGVRCSSHVWWTPKSVQLKVDRVIRCREGKLRCGVGQVNRPSAHSEEEKH